jgi:hypothetical protein
VRFVFIAERLSLVLANGPGRGFSGGDDGLGSANVINTVHPLCAVAVAGCSTVACRTPRHPARGFGEAGRPGRGRVSPGLPCCRPARSQPTPRLDLGQCFVGFSEQPHDDACTVGEAEQIAERASHRFGSWTADSTRRGNTRHGKPKRSARPRSSGLSGMPWRACCPNRSATFWNGKQSSGCGSLSFSTASTSELRYEHGRDS